MAIEDEDEKAANERDIAKMRATVKAAKEEPPEDDDEPEELETAPDEPKEGDEIRPTRQQKKRERGESLVQAAKREAEEARREAAELRGRVDELSRRPMQQAPAPKPEDDPLIAERDQIRREYQAYQTRVRDAQSREGVTQAELDKLGDEGWELKERMDLNLIRRENARNKPAADQERRKSEQQNAEMQLHARHGDVTRDPRAVNLFRANYSKLLALGASDNPNDGTGWETVDKAMDQTRSELRMPPRGGRPAPSDATRARMSGMPRGGAGGGAEPKEKGIKITSDIRRQANLAYPHLPKEKRLQAWADASGKYLEDA